jgi:hypothetical protein
MRAMRVVLFEAFLPFPVEKATQSRMKSAVKQQASRF